MKFLSIVFALAFVTIPTGLFAQSSLQGSVSDSSTGETLVGVNVYLVGTSLGSATNIEGQYRIMAIPPGVYSIRFSYVGFETKDMEVNFLAQADQRLDVMLNPSVILGEEVVVTAQMRGQMAAINQQITSNTMVNVVSEERIQELPDANAAAAIGRLSGVSLVRSGGEASQVVLRGLSSKFSTITIDGVRITPTEANTRGVDLSTISQGSLAGIELYKALTPDKDADAIAGSVNLVTRKAPSERLVRVDARGNYNALDQSASQYNYDARYGERFLDDFLGVQVTGHLEKTIRSNETTDHNWDQSITNFTDYEVSQFLVTYLNEFRQRRGGSILLDINTPDNGTIRFDNVFNQTSRDYITHNRNYRLGGEVTYEFRDRSTEISTFSSSVRGENYLFGFETSWNIAFSESKVRTPYDYLFNFTEASSSTSGMGSVPAEYRKGPVEQWIPYAYNNFQIAAMNRAYDRTSRNYDREKTAFMNIGRQYTVGETMSGELKIGGKYKSKSRSFTTDESIHTIYLFEVGEYVKQADGSFGSKDFSGTPFDGLVGTQGVSMYHFLDANPKDRGVYGKYRLFPLVNKHLMRLWRSLNIHGYKDARDTEFDEDAEYRRNIEIAGATYGLTERLLAGYAMNTLNIGSFFTLMTGVRIEHDDNDYLGTYSPLPLSGFIFTQTGYLYQKNVNHKETNVFFNGQGILRPTEFMNVRLAAYQALARPDFNHRLPKFIVRSASGNTLNIGNPYLKNALATNYEIQTQFFGDKIGLLTVSAFYKDLKNMFHSISGISFTSDSVYVYGEKVSRNDVLDKLGVDWRLYTDTAPFNNADFSLTYQYNSSRPTRVWGLEVEHQTDLRFLPWLFRNLVLNYNFTIVRSETWVTVSTTVETPNPPRPPITSRSLEERKQRLEDQPEFFANASLGYDIAGFSVRVSYFYQGAYNRSFSDDQRGDIITNSYSRWDVALKQQVSDNISLILNVNNVTDTQEGATVANRLTGWRLLDTNNRYGTTVDFGVRLEF